jgi:hypothetical protein
MRMLFLISLAVVLSPSLTAGPPERKWARPGVLEDNDVQMEKTFSFHLKADHPEEVQTLHYRELMPKASFSPAAFPQGCFELFDPKAPSPLLPAYVLCGERMARSPHAVQGAQPQLAFDTSGGPSPGGGYLVVIGWDGAAWKEIFKKERIGSDRFEWVDLDRDGHEDLVYQGANALPELYRFDGKTYVLQTEGLRRLYVDRFHAIEREELDLLLLAYALQEYKTFYREVRNACPGEALIQGEPKACAEAFLASLKGEPTLQDLEQWSMRSRGRDADSPKRVDVYVYFWTKWGLRDLGKTGALVAPEDLGDSVYSDRAQFWWFGPCHAPD